MIGEIKMHGFDELKQLLRDLPDQVKTQALRQSVREMGLITLGYAIANSPYRTGALRRNIKLIREKVTSPWEEYNGLRVRTARAKQRVKASKEGRDISRDDPYYWFFQEFGYTSRGGRKIAGKEYLRKALLSHPQEHIDAFLRDFKPRLERIADRALKKQMRGWRIK